MAQRGGMVFTLLSLPVNLASVQQRLGYTFQYPLLLEAALTHRGLSGSRNPGRSAIERHKQQIAILEGEVAAYYHVLDVIKQQTALAGVEFSDPALAAFDPDELLQSQRQSA